MSFIKSALELALEKTKDIQSDPAALRAHTHRTEGKRLFAKYRDDRDFDLGGAISAQDRTAREHLREGAFEVALANLNMPQEERDLAAVELVFGALRHLIRDHKTLAALEGQLHSFLKQYLDDRTQLIESMRQQYAPRLRQREQQIAQKTGQRVRLDPATDPEFAKVLQSQMNRLQQHYGGAIEQVRSALGELFRAGK